MDQTYNFESISHVDPSIIGPRIGRLRVEGRHELETPNFLALTSRGVVPHMTPDVVTGTRDIKGVYMALEDFIEKGNKGPPPILNSPGSPLHSFTAMQGPIIVLAPRRTPAVTSPNGSSNSAISIFTSTGFQLLSNQSYLSFIQNLRPDIAISLADLTYGSLPGNKRIAKMGDRTEQWLSELLENRQGRAVFAPVLPIDFHNQSEYINRLADEQADEIAGLAFYDSNLLPDIPATTSLARLPRLSLDEPASPHHIIRQISLGMDIFTAPFLGLATDAGIALTFCFPSPSHEDTTNLNGGGHSIVPLGIDMWASTHSTSLLPLSASCSCYTCTSHHRAFIQHLLSAKEMLGWVLLQIHNHHILSTFFSGIRSSLLNGTFTADAEKFARFYESELPEKTGKGPRVRGYQFKSDGPGEARMNEAAWGNLAGNDQIDGTIPDEDADDLEGNGLAEKANHV